MYRLVKYIIPIFGLLIWLDSGYAQRPETPVIDSVSVKPDSTISLSWSVSEDSIIDGYYIYRFPYDADNFVGQNFMEIDSIRGGQNTTYTDDTTVNGAQPEPYKRVERYRIAAFNASENSLMSEPQSTVYLDTIQFDTCKAQNVLKWLQVEGWETDNTEYTVFAKTKTEGDFLVIAERITDTTFVHKQIHAEKAYRYYIRAYNTAENYSQTSNIQEVYTDFPEQPAMIDFNYVTVNSGGNIEVAFSIKEDVNAEYVLFRTDSAKKDTTKLERFKNPANPVRYQDGSASPFELHHYMVKAYNHCSELYKTSSVAHNILLNVSENDQAGIVHELTWNSYADWKAGVEEYEIYRSSAGKDATLVSTTSKTTYTESLSSETETSGMCYYVKAVPANSTGESEPAKSNTACVSNKAIIAMPNAFKPGSDIPENRVFKPVMNVVSDYDFYIYDRWGNIVFHTQNISEGWRGKITGSRKAPEGVYVYKIVFTKDGKKHRKTSTVTLIRE